jgi:hypothetical protein
MIRGNLLEFSRADGALRGSVQFQERELQVSVETDGVDEGAAVSFAYAVLSDLEAGVTRAKRVAANKLLERYNSGWNCFERFDANGALESVSRPKLSIEEFVDEISLSSIGFSGDDCVEFFFENTELFWGHTIIVSVFDNLDWDGACAQLFG